LLPVILPLFMKAVPTVHIIIEEGTATELAEKLAHGEVDLIISLLNTDTEGFERVHLFDEMMYLAVPGNYKSHSVHEIFRNIPLITSGKGQVMEVLFEQLKRELGERENLMECRNMSTALSLVDAGVGVTLVPSYMKDYGEPYKDIAYLSLSGFLTEQERRVCIFFRKEQYLSRAEKKFIDCSLRAINNKEK